MGHKICSPSRRARDCASSGRAPRLFKKKTPPPQPGWIAPAASEPVGKDRQRVVCRLHSVYIPGVACLTVFLRNAESGDEISLGLHMSMHTSMHISMHMSMHTSMHTPVYMSIHMPPHMPTYTCPYTCPHTCPQGTLGRWHREKKKAVDQDNASRCV